MTSGGMENYRPDELSAAVIRVGSMTEEQLQSARKHAAQIVVRNDPQCTDEDLRDQIHLTLDMLGLLPASTPLRRRR